MKWTEETIGRFIANHVLDKKCIVLVPNCTWPGHECDILAVTQDLRVIEVEAKISRADLKADAKKDKWWHRKLVAFGEQVVERMPDGRLKSAHRPPVYDETRLQWPRKVWKHYYALPEEIWRGRELFDALPSPYSGVILLSERGGRPRAFVERRATPCRDADRLTSQEAINVARLANIRMWSAIEARERREQPAEVAA